MTKVCGQHGMLWQNKLQRRSLAFHSMPLPANVCGTNLEVTASPSSPAVLTSCNHPLDSFSLSLRPPGWFLGAFNGTHRALKNSVTLQLISLGEFHNIR